MLASLVPFNRKNSLANRLEGFQNILDEFFADSWPYFRAFARDTFRLDVQETEKEYLVEAELPGINKDEIDVELNDGRLTIYVQREESINEEKKNYVHRERRYSSASRSIYLPDAKPEGVKAKLENGLLSITIPKQEKPDNTLKIDIE